jgi:hypothetical protein
MRKIFFQLILVASIFSSLWCAKPVSAQDSRFERRFPNPKTEVDKAIQEIQASVKGRLPILEGFVEERSEPLDHFDRGYYECLAKASPDAEGGTLVRVVAKITAWYSGSTPALSGYRVLPSNGRIETDLLDHLGELLGNRQSGNPPGAIAAPPRPSSLLPSPTVRPALPQPPAGFQPAVAHVAEPSHEDLNSLKQRREEAERNAKSLNNDVQNLEEILRNQSHPDNLAAVRKSDTPVLAKPGGPVLLSAEAEDEFEMLSIEGAWVHVQISGVSRGWIQGALLDLPEGFAGISKTGSASGGDDKLPFHITRQETHPFSGTWPQLQGKTVRIIWVEPASGSSPTSTTEAKRKFAMSVFADAYKNQSSLPQPPDGAVVVFDAADGGQISATMSSLAQWQAGQLSEASFWKQCSIDPPDLLLVVHRP